MAGSNPRAARIAALIQRVIASTIETHLHDKRLENLTITEVRVTNDLQIAWVYWTQLGHAGKEQGERKRAQQALRQASGRLRALVGAKAGLRLTPQLRFVFDEVPGEAHEIEDILAVAHQRDTVLQQARAGAQYAGEADPYKHDDEDAADDDTLDDDGDGQGDDGFDEADGSGDTDWPSDTDGSGRTVGGVGDFADGYAPVDVDRDAAADTDGTRPAPEEA